MLMRASKAPEITPGYRINNNAYIQQQQERRRRKTANVNNKA